MINFSEKYDHKKFGSFLKNFLPEDFLVKNEELEVAENNEYFKKAILLGSVKSLDELVVIEIERKRSEKSRITITKELFKFLDSYGYSRALIITFSKKEDHYRFSFITSDLNWVGTKVNKEFSDPKRLSFLLGVGSKVHTATKHLIEQGKVTNFDDLYSRFNIEIINDEFYEHYKNLFLDLVDNLNKDKKFSTFAKKINLKTVDFAKRLLSQIVFCYFLQKKGWLTEEATKKFGEGKNSFLRDKFEEYEKKKENFYNKFLEFFFYLGLNNENKDHYVKEINCKVPYIGGGLFEYYDGYDWQKENLNIPNSFFSNKEKNGILDIFDLYNFTVDENENIDVEISIDPEMLGKTFEKLLDIKDRKSSGTFYTPREIVKFMSEDALISYLNDKSTQLFSENVIRNFIKFENIENSEDENQIKKNAEFIDTLLKEVKICDPAVGTGAFVVEMVNLISQKRKTLDAYLGKSRNIYLLKLQSIKRSIYGVDIESHAVEIAKLRLWLSLIINETNYEKINPLPNLNFKFLVGNSLYQSSQLSLFEYPIFEKIQTLKDEFLTTTSYLKQRKLSKDIENLYEELDQNKESFNYVKNFSEIFSNKKNALNGFDIVIGNPPYVRGDTKKNDLETRSENIIYKKLYEDVYGGGRTDLYIFFIKKGEEISKKNGIISFIISNKWMSANYGKNCRIHLSKKKITNIIDFGNLPIFQAGVNVNILTYKNKSNDLNDKIKLLDAEKIIEKLVLDNNHKVNFITVKKYLKNLHDIFINHHHSTVGFRGDGSSWTVNNLFNSPLFLKADKKIKVKFKDKNISIRAGIKTGFNDAFIIDKKTYKRWIEEDINCKKYLKPFLRGRYINMWSQREINEYIVFADRSFEISKVPNLIKNHLLKFKKQLSERATVPNSHPWYQLMQPQTGFIDDFENKIKIVWRDISIDSNVTIINQGVYPDMTCYYIPINDKALCAWMYSDFFVKYLKMISSNLGSAIRWKKQWIEQCYFYPKELKKDLENIYDLSVNNPNDGINNLNNIIEKFIK